MTNNRKEDNLYGLSSFLLRGIKSYFIAGSKIQYESISSFSWRVISILFLAEMRFSDMRILFNFSGYRFNRLAYLYDAKPQ